MTLLLAALGAVPALAGEARTLDWHELVPADWEPPIIAIAHDEAATREVDRAALVGELDEKQVRLPGYMKPIVFEERSVTGTLLSVELENARQYYWRVQYMDDTGTWSPAYPISPSACRST